MDHRPTDEELVEYVMDIANRMVHGWQISTCFQRNTFEDSNARCHVGVTRQQVCITFHGSFFTNTSEQQRGTVVHELLHLINEPILHPVSDHLFETRAVSYGVYQLLNEVMRKENEIAIERLTRIIEPFMPLPKWAVPDEEPGEPDRGSDPEEAQCIT